MPLGVTIPGYRHAILSEAVAAAAPDSAAAATAVVRRGVDAGTPGATGTDSGRTAFRAGAEFVSGHRSASDGKLGSASTGPHVQPIIATLVKNHIIYDRARNAPAGQN